MKKRSKLNLSNFHNCTMKMGYLYPVNLLEVLPGDTLQINASVFLRLAPMVAPVMHPVHMGVYHFFVPSRVLGDAIGFDFESFITGGQDGADSQTLPKVTLNATNSPVGALADAFGIPVQMLKGTSNSFSVNSLPFVSYYMIWNEYFRDQDLQTEFDYSTLSGTPSSLSLLRPDWQKDYFTTARPWPQKGPDVTIPVNPSSDAIEGQPFVYRRSPDGLGTVLRESLTGNVLDGAKNPYYDPAHAGNMGTGFRGGNLLDGAALFMSSTTTQKEVDGPLSSQNPDAKGRLAMQVDFPAGGSSGSTYKARGILNGIDVDVSQNLAFNPDVVSGSGVFGNVSIQDLREGFAIQRFQEHRALFGSRYEDYLRYLGVRPQDARLQMPEYLGGFSAPVQFSEVLQTSADSANSGVGDLYGHGIGAGRGRRIRRFIPEHGYIVSVMLVRPISVYAQGLERLWSKSTRLDFWQKELEHIGQQEVLNSEVYADGTSSDATTFGYQNRYDEYRRGVNVVTGEFRTNQDFWTMARIFANRPALNSDFVTCNPTDRIFQVNEVNSDQVYCMVKNSVVARRLVSKNGNPI